MTVLTRSAAVLAAALLGLLVASVGDSDALLDSGGYLFLAALLLGVGLIGSTRGISLKEVRDHFGTVLLAVTIGVIAKAALIASVVYLVFRDPALLVLGVVMAQIDPLSVAAMGRRERISPRARSILSIWASFDDPVTVLLTIYVSAFALDLLGPDRAALGDVAVGRPIEFLFGLLANLAFAAVAFAIWYLLGTLRRRYAGAGPRGPGAPDEPGGSRGPAGSTGPRDPGGPTGPSEAAAQRRRRARLAINTMAVLVLAGLIVFAAWQFLMLGLAITGLFFRPVLGRVLGRATLAAFLIAAFVLGMLLVRGVNPLIGITLGVAAVLAHALVSVPISHGLAPGDRAYLAAGQQNGITAVILALLLERDFPGTVGIVAIAIVTINVIHGVTNAALDRHRMAGPPNGNGSATGESGPGARDGTEGGAGRRSAALMGIAREQRLRRRASSAAPVPQDPRRSPLRR